jgi:hypothetical protein
VDQVPSLAARAKGETMDELATWLEAHDKLAGWAQFFGAMLALVVTYFTAFAPGWRRKRQLQKTGARLVANGFEVIESYHRTSANFAPISLSVRAASLTMTSVVNDMSRFPIFELDDQGSNSLARRLGGLMLSTLGLFLDHFAGSIEGREADEEERAGLKIMLDSQLAIAVGLATGAKLERPVWPIPGAEG